MNHASAKQKRALAIDPSTRGFGFAIMEGPNSLIDWGVKEARSGDKNAGCLRQIADLMERYRPDLIVVEDYTGKGSRRCVRIQELISKILELAAKKRIKTRGFSRAAMRKAFSELGAQTKHQIATAISERLLELAPRLPPFRKPWMSEDYRMSIFDAVAFALTSFYFTSKRKGGWLKAR